jgi:hypothetical protein
MQFELDDNDIQRIAEKLHSSVMGSEHMTKYHEAVECRAKANAESFVGTSLSDTKIKAAFKESLRDEKHLVCKMAAQMLIAKVDDEDLKAAIRSEVAQQVEDLLTNN